MRRTKRGFTAREFAIRVRAAHSGGKARYGKRRREIPISDKLRGE